MPGALEEFNEDLPDVRRDVPIYLIASEPGAFARPFAYDDENTHRSNSSLRLGIEASGSTGAHQHDWTFGGRASAA